MTDIGVLKALGSGDLPDTGILISAIAGLDNPVDKTVRIGRWFADNEVAENVSGLGQIMHSVKGVLVADRVWYQTSNPLAFWGKNTIDPDEGWPLLFKPDPSLKSPLKAPVSTLGKVVFQLLKEDTDGTKSAVIYVLDSETGVPQ